MAITIFSILIIDITIVAAVAMIPLEAFVREMPEKMEDEFLLELITAKADMLNTEA